MLRFLRSPVEIQGNGKVERVVVARNELYRDDSGAIRARDTGERETIECGMVLRSIGYKGVPVDGAPFDERKGVIPNDGGRVKDAESGDQVPGLYATGWIKRGPSGVIGTNKKDGQETVDNLFADLEAGAIPEAPLAGDREATEALLAERKPDHVTFEGWEAIDAAEVERGKPHGRPRVKFCRVEEMVEVVEEPEDPGLIRRPGPRRLRRCRRPADARFGPQLVRAVGDNRVGCEGEHPLEQLDVVDGARVDAQSRRARSVRTSRSAEQEVLDRDAVDAVPLPPTPASASGA